MSDEVESMMYVGEVPWHGLGTACQGAPTIEEALKASGLDWPVGYKGLKTDDGKVARTRVIYRETDGKHLGEVGPEYTVLQNREVFDFFQPLLDHKEASIECAGSLRGGKRVWVLAKINRDPTIIVPQADDIVARYILLAHAHEYGFSARVGFTPVRVVCMNTLVGALQSKASKLLRVAHKGNMVLTLSKVREIMNVADQSFSATAEQYRYLAGHHVHRHDLAKYVNLVFQPLKTKLEGGGEGGGQGGGAAFGGGEGWGDRTGVASEGGDSSELKSSSPRPGTIAARIEYLFEHGIGNSVPGVRGTWWAAYNAVTQYLSYERGQDRATRLNSLWFEDSARVNQRALSTGVAMASGRFAQLN